jgi:hypothetical protein
MAKDHSFKSTKNMNDDEELGALQYSAFESKLQTVRIGMNEKNFRWTYMQIERLHATMWALVPLSFGAYEKDKKEAFESMLIQAKDIFTKTTNSFGAAAEKSCKLSSMDKDDMYMKIDNVCPYCGKETDRCGNPLEPDHKPVPGNISVCVDCYNASRLDENMKLTKIDMDNVALEEAREIHKAQVFLLEQKENFERMKGKG